MDSWGTRPVALMIKEAFINYKTKGLMPTESI